MEERYGNVHISEDISKEIEDTPEHVVTPTKILLTSEEEENKCNNMISNDGNRKKSGDFSIKKACQKVSKKERKTSPVKRKGF